MNSQLVRSLYTTADDDEASRLLVKREAEEYRLANTWVNPRDGSIMVLVPAGEFILGSTPDEIQRARDGWGDGLKLDLAHETPRSHAFVVAFYIGIHEVTNRQFARFLTAVRPDPERLQKWLPVADCILPPTDVAESYGVNPGYDRHPVAHVTWTGAEAYCRWAELRLPKEIEWEKAARGTDGRLFPWGDEWREDCLQWKQTAAAGGAPTAPVDAFPQGASPYGVLQMAGNVEEWCADTFLPDAYGRLARDGSRPLENGRGRVVRGGSCVGRSALEFRCAMRRANSPDRVTKRFIGFRCASGELHWLKERPSAVAEVCPPSVMTASPPAETEKSPSPVARS